MTDTLPTADELLDALLDHPDLAAEVIQRLDALSHQRKLRIAMPWEVGEGGHTTFTRHDPLGRPVAIIRRLGTHRFEWSLSFEDRPPGKHQGNCASLNITKGTLNHHLLALGWALVEEDGTILFVPELASLSGELSDPGGTLALEPDP